LKYLANKYLIRKASEKSGAFLLCKDSISLS